jgi:hypothetical protein
VEQSPLSQFVHFFDFENATTTSNPLWSNTTQLNTPLFKSCNPMNLTKIARNGNGQLWNKPKTLV